DATTDFTGGNCPTWLPFVRSPGLVPDDRIPHRATPTLFGPVVTTRALTAPTILVFDSGLGGLTVFREITAARPDARFVYAADDAVFPYGRLDEARLVTRVLSVMERLIATVAPDLVVIACNTAST